MLTMECSTCKITSEEDEEEKQQKGWLWNDKNMREKHILEKEESSNSDNASHWTINVWLGGKKEPWTVSSYRHTRIEDDLSFLFRRSLWQPWNREGKRVMWEDAGRRRWGRARGGGTSPSRESTCCRCGGQSGRYQSLEASLRVSPDPSTQPALRRIYTVWTEDQCDSV